MKKIYRFEKWVIAITLGLVSVFSVVVENVFAENTEITISGKKYEFENNSKYDLSSADSVTELVADGKLNIQGNLSELVEIEGIPSYGVDGSATFSYTFGDIAKETAEDQWHVVDDKSKEINGVKISSSIGKGTILVETSQDGVEWVKDANVTNVLKKGQTADSFYKTNKVQLVSGSFYRITVAYTAEKKTGEKRTLFIKNDINEKKNVVEVYKVYLHDMKSSKLITNSTVSKKLGSKTRTAKNEGYYGSKTIELKDPHYGWELGEFYVSGYTDDVKDTSGNFVFLKNVGDQITLWFNLLQNIDKLNGNDQLIINRDTNGYDRDFEIKKTDFGRGALLIRKTDYQNKTGQAEIYTNYLEANAKTNANTVVGLFEEGDYEVALDYEIKNTPRKVAGIEVVPEYSDYTIRFTFSIRNSNCMVFPFDIETGEELIDKAITTNGFRLDLARSRYLNINVQKYQISKGSNGYVMDERFNRAAKDGDSYEDEGVYVFTVSNDYTGEKTTKTIYVGESPIIKALAKSGMNLSEINNVLNNGGKIDKDGKVIPKK